MSEAVAMKPAGSTGGLGTFERYLSVWVALCMAAGIGLGKIMPGVVAALRGVEIEDAAPLIRPAAVESRVSGVIGGVKVSGYVDLLDIEGRIIDSKSALRPLKGIAHDHRLQLTSYVMITAAASGACRLDTVTKGKTVSLIQKSFFINEKDRHYAETIYPMVQDSIREGIFLPRRSSPLCSRRFCGFWNVCEKEYGGSVRCD